MRQARQCKTVVVSTYRYLRCLAVHEVVSNLISGWVRIARIPCEHHTMVDGAGNCVVNMLCGHHLSVETQLKEQQLTMDHLPCQARRSTQASVLHAEEPAERGRLSTCLEEISQEPASQEETHPKAVQPRGIDERSLPVVCTLLAKPEPESLNS